MDQIRDENCTKSEQKINEIVYKWAIWMGTVKSISVQENFQ